MRGLIPFSTSLALLIGLACSGLACSAQAQTVAFDRYCLQGRTWGYPGNCQFATYEQCMATASGTDAYCGINPQWAFAQQAAPPLYYAPRWKPVRRNKMRQHRHD